MAAKKRRRRIAARSPTAGAGPAQVKSVGPQARARSGEGAVAGQVARALGGWRLVAGARLQSAAAGLARGRPASRAIAGLVAPGNALVASNA